MKRLLTAILMTAVIAALTACGSMKLYSFPSAGSVTINIVDVSNPASLYPSLKCSVSRKHV